MSAEALHKDATRGAQAEALLRNEMLTDAFDAFKRDCTTALLATKSHQDQERRNFVLAIQVSEFVRTHLQNAAGNGKLALRQLDEIAKAGERKSRFSIV